jgi:demethylmenaquinone methyltransferase/2-methoxy-6-polyprenyl-1,4-benzoquinol methylase
MAGPQLAPRPTFDCLWCGRSWTTRSADDLEGWAKLCPDCLGKAGDNAFLRFRLRDALAARAGASHSATDPARPTEAAKPAEPTERTQPNPAAPDTARPVGDLDAEMVAYYEARAGEYDDWYLRRGRYAYGPIHDAAWNAELDAAGRWLDALPIQGEIVELAAGTGWWSPLLASKGELWLYDAAEAPLERARERLLAHGLRAHIHLRDAWARPDRAVDAVVLGFWLSHVDRDRTTAFLELARQWLRPGGILAIIDSLADPQSGADDHPPVVGDRARRQVVDGRDFTIVKVQRDAAQLETALAAAGFRDVQATTTGRFFVLASCTA